MDWVMSAYLEKIFPAGMVVLFGFLPGWLAFKLSVKLEESFQRTWVGVVISIIPGLFFGIVLNSLPTLFLASLNLWSPLIFYSISGVMSAGFIIFLMRRNNFRAREVVFTAAIAFFLILSLMAIPHRGEWLLGGWDPGIYVNEALLVSRTGGYSPAPDPFYQAAGVNVVDSLARNFGSYREMFPGIPVDGSGMALHPAFPRLTSALLAVLHRTGGWNGLTHAPLFFYIIAIGLTGAMAWRMGFNQWIVMAVIACVGGQSIAIYHSHTPCSEIVEFMLLAGLGFLLTFRGKGNSWVLWSTVVLFLLSANRISFILFGALFIAVMAIVDWERLDRRTVIREHGLWALAILGGALLHGLLTPVAMAKLQHILPRIYLWSGVLICTAILLDGVAMIAAIRERLKSIIMAGLRISVAVVVLTGIVLAMVFHGGEWQRNIEVLYLYTGGWLLLVSILGIFWFCCDTVKPQLAGWLLFLCIASLVVIKQKHAADLYPWATKRFLPYFVPFIGISAALFLNAVMKYVRRPWLIPLLATALVAVNIDLVRSAWTNTEYDGVESVMGKISDQIKPGDWLICDHFWWGTPLALTYGHSVLNGYLLGSAMDEKKKSEIWDAFRALSSRDRHILFLTSTPEGLNYYFEPGRESLEKRWRYGPVYLNEIHHHSSNRDFPVRTRKYVFMLYEWQPELK